MFSSSIIRRIIPFLIYIFLQILQIKTQNDLDYSLESPMLLTMSEITENIMNRNLNLSCAGLKDFFNSQAYQDIEKILNVTSNITEVIENRKKYHSRIKRCSEMEMQNKILRQFENRNRRKEVIGNHKLDRVHFKQKHQKDDHTSEINSHEFLIHDNSEENANEYDVLRGDLARSMHDSTNTDLYLRTYRTVTGNPFQFTTNSASIKIGTKYNHDKQQSSTKDKVKKRSKILKKNLQNIKDSSTTSYSIPNDAKPMLQQKKKTEMKSTKALEKGGKTKKDLLFSLMDNIQNVTEDVFFKNIDKSLKFNSEIKSSLTEDVRDEESLIEYETVTPYQLININDFNKLIPSSSMTENIQIEQRMQGETKKQLQSKIEEPIKIRKKFLEIIKIADSTKNQTKLSFGNFNKNSMQNKKKEKEETRENSNFDLKHKSDKTPDIKNAIDARSDSLENQYGGILEKKSEIFIREPVKSEIEINTTQEKNNFENAYSHSNLKNTITPKEIIKKISIQYFTTPENSYTEPQNIRQTSLETTQSSQHPSSDFHHVEMSSKNLINNQTFHFKQNSTIHSSYTNKNDPKLVPVILELLDLEKVLFSQNEESFKKYPASFTNHSSKPITIQPLLEFKTTSEGRIPIQVRHSKENSISGFSNKTEIALDLVGRAHQLILKDSQKSQHFVTTSNPIRVLLLEKLEKFRDVTTPTQKLGKISSLEHIHSNEDISSKLTSPQKTYYFHSYSQQPDLDKISHLRRQHLQHSHLEKNSTNRSSHLFETTFEKVTLPMRSHSENQIIPQLVHKDNELSLSKKISTLKPSQSTTTFLRETTLPQKSQMENHSIPQPVHNHFTPQLFYSSDVSSEKNILPRKFHEENHIVFQPLHHFHYDPKLTHFEKTTIYHPIQSNKTFSRGKPQKFNETSSSIFHSQFNHSNEISTPLVVVSPERVIFNQNHTISGIDNNHPYLYNLERFISYLPSRLNEQSSKATMSTETSYKNKLFKMPPRSKLSHFVTGVTNAYPQHLHQTSFLNPTTKLPELHLEEKFTYSTSFPLHLSTIQIKTSHHSTTDNTTRYILEAIKRLEKKKVEEVKNLEKSQLEVIHKNRLINLSHTTLPYFDAYANASQNKIHIADGISSHTPKTLKHEAQNLSSIGKDIKILHTHDITKPYPMKPTTYAMLESDLELVEKIVKPLPPLNPNDNWKYVKKLDNYYEKQKQFTTPQPRTTRLPTIPTSKSRAIFAPTIIPPIPPITVATSVQPSMPLRNITKELKQQPTSTQKPSPVNYNINSTINKNYNITVNFVPPDSALHENNKVDEDHPEDNQIIIEDESDPFFYLARSTEASKNSNDSVKDFDSPLHPSLFFNFSLSNEKIKQPINPAILNVFLNKEPISFVQTKIIPNDDFFLISNSSENKDTVLQSSTHSVTKLLDSLTTAATPYRDIINNLKSSFLKVQSQPFFDNTEFSTTQSSTILTDQKNIPLQTSTVCSNGNNSQQNYNNIIILSNKTEELMEILRLLSMINIDDKKPSTIGLSPSPIILQSAKSSEEAFLRPHSNHFAEIKSLLRSIHKSQMTPLQVIELRKSIGDLLKVLEQSRNKELSRLYLSKLNPMVGDGKDCVLAITQINEYIELLELMMVYLTRDPNKLLDEIKDARFHNFESPYPHDDPQRRLIEDQFYFVHPKILNEFIDVYKRYSKDEPYFGKPTWQFSQENGPRRTLSSRSRSLGGSLNNLFRFKELIPAFIHDRAPMYRPGVQYAGY